MTEPIIRLRGQADNVRKMDIRASYSATSFDLIIGSLQIWSCAAFGRLADKALRIREGQWIEIEAEPAEITIAGRKVNGLKAKEILVAEAPRRSKSACKIVDVDIPNGARRGTVEITDQNGVSYVLESYATAIEDHCRGLKIGQEVTAEWQDFKVLTRLKGNLVPILASSLISIQTQLNLLAA